MEEIVPALIILLTHFFILSPLCNDDLILELSRDQRIAQCLMISISLKLKLLNLASFFLAEFQRAERFWFQSKFIALFVNFNSKHINKREAFKQKV